MPDDYDTSSSTASLWQTLLFWKPSSCLISVRTNSNLAATENRASDRSSKTEEVESSSLGIRLWALPLNLTPGHGSAAVTEPPAPPHTQPPGPTLHSGGTGWSGDQHTVGFLPAQNTFIRTLMSGGDWVFCQLQQPLALPAVCPCSGQDTDTQSQQLVAFCVLQKNTPCHSWVHKQMCVNIHSCLPMYM